MCWSMYGLARRVRRIRQIRVPERWPRPKGAPSCGEQGLDLATLTGHGPDGAVVAADVIAASNNVNDQPMESGLRRAEAPGISDKAAGAVSSATAATLPVSRIWQVMARRMTESWTTVPHFYVSIECEAGGLLECRDSLQQRQSIKISMTDPGRGGCRCPPSSPASERKLERRTH